MDLNTMGIGYMQQCLEVTEFPADKEEVASEAESNGAPQNLVNQITNTAME